MAQLYPMMLHPEDNLKQYHTKRHFENNEIIFTTEELSVYFLRLFVSLCFVSHDDDS